MHTIRRSNERGLTKIDWLTSHHSFSFGDYWDPKFAGFRSLRVINEDFIAGGGGFGKHPHRDMEIVTYVVSGALEHGDSLGTTSTLEAGCIQRMSAGTGIMHSEFNHSKIDSLHLLQIWITPERRGITPGYEESSLDAIPGERSWKLIASPNPPKGALTIHQNAEIYSSKLHEGERVTFSPRENGGFWLQLIDGEVTLNGSTISSGDAIFGEDEAALELLAKSESHLLLFQL